MSGAKKTLALSLALICAPAAALAQEQPVALVGGTIHTMSGDDIAGGTVVMYGGKIVGVGLDAAVPSGARRIELDGKHVYPGLIDANTVLGLTEIGSVKGTRDTEEIGKINPNLRAEMAVNPDSALLPVARTGGVLLAHIAARSGLISGTSALIATEGWTWEDMTVRAPVFLHLRWPNMRIDRSGRNDKEPKEQLKEREEALATIRDTFRQARAYWKAREAVGVPQGDEDVKWDAMRRVVNGAMRVAIEADDLTQITAALDWAEREQVSIAIVGGADAWRAADELRFRDVPVILGRTFSLPRRAYEPVDSTYRNAARLHAAGVQIAFGTGGSGFAAANARNLRDHAAMAVAHGLPKEAALHALTLGAAEILGADDRVGSIEEGKQATLIVVDRDLFDFRARVSQAFVAGREVSLRDRQRKLYEKYRARPR